MPKCPHCGEEYISGDDLCPSCFGTLSIVPESVKPKTEVKNNEVENSSGANGGFGANPYAGLFNNPGVVIEDDNEEIIASVQKSEPSLPEKLSQNKDQEKLVDSTKSDPDKPRNRASLLVANGSSTGTEFLIGGHSVMIGRWDPDVKAFVEVDLTDIDKDVKVSRKHARITEENGKYYIEDLGSTNGTFINKGDRLIPGDKLRLNNGDEIIIGKVFLRFIIK